MPQTSLTLPLKPRYPPIPFLPAGTVLSLLLPHTIPSPLTHLTNVPFARPARLRIGQILTITTRADRRNRLLIIEATGLPCDPWPKHQMLC